MVERPEKEIIIKKEKPNVLDRRSSKSNRRREREREREREGEREREQ